MAIFRRKILRSVWLLLPLWVGSQCLQAQEALDAQNISLRTPAERGFWFIRNQPLGLSKLPVSEFDEIWNVWPDDLKAQAEKVSPSERRKLAFARYGMTADPINPEGAPVGVVDDGQGSWVMNCLSCHQGTVAGKVHWGAPNTHFAFQTLVDDVGKVLKIRGQKIDPLRNLFPLGATNGTTNAQIFSVFLSAFRDRELNSLPLPRLPKFKHHDLDAPPFWITKRKKNLYIDGYVPKTHRVIMQFALVPANTADEIKALEDSFRDVLQWIESTEAPKYPWSIAQPLAAKGELIFNESCASCHGTYGPDGTYPEVRVPMDEIGTDPVRLEGMPVEHRRFLKESWFGNFGEIDVVEKPEGYVAPPLDGIWASAPYFHNGSVPTLWHVMNPTKRPAVWMRVSADGYDVERIGLDVQVFDQMPSGFERSDQKRQFFDTSMSGKSAAGHDFPDELDEDEKLAVLEYLKSL